MARSCVIDYPAVSIATVPEVFPVVGALLWYSL